MSFRFDLGHAVRLSGVRVTILDRCCPKPKGQRNWTPVNLYLVRLGERNVWRNEKIVSPIETQQSPVNIG